MDYKKKYKDLLVRLIEAKIEQRLCAERSQKHWKPSEEQMIALRHVISGCSYDIEPLLELETKLKEL